VICAGILAALGLSWINMTLKPPEGGSKYNEGLIESFIQMIPSKGLNHF